MRNRMLVLAAAVLGLTASSAFAADLGVRAPVTPAPVATTWTGFYAGLNAGGGWANVSSDNVSSDLSGFVGGGQLGYNWESGNWLLGIEGDFQGSAQSTSDSATILGIPFTVDQDLQWFATLRGRLGYVSGPWLFYVTGGAAWVNYKLTVSAPGGSVDDETTKAAWTVGGGVEWMFVPRWSAKLEYLYIDTGETSVTLFDVPFNARAKDNIVRVGVNYHF